MLTNGIVVLFSLVITTIVPLVAPAWSGPVFVGRRRGTGRSASRCVVPGCQAMEAGTCTVLPGAACGTLMPPTWPSVTT